MSDERSGPGGQRVRVVLERAGGIVGRPIRRGLDTADLPPQEADSLRALAAALPAPASAARHARAVGPDRLTYTLEIDEGGRRRVHEFAEPVPDEAKPLIQLLSRAPLLPARRPDRQ